MHRAVAPRGPPAPVTMIRPHPHEHERRGCVVSAAGAAGGRHARGRDPVQRLSAACAAAARHRAGGSASVPGGSIERCIRANGTSTPPGSDTATRSTTVKPSAA